MAECGASYAHLLTAAGGRDPENMCTGLWCNEVDCDTWQAIADGAYGLYIAAWNKCFEVNNARAEELRAQAEEYEAAYAEVENTCSVFMAFGAAGANEAVAKLIAATQKGLCVMELLNQGIKDAGGEHIHTPLGNPKPSGGLFSGEPSSPVWKWAAIGLGAVAVVGIGVYAYGRAAEARGLPTLRFERPSTNSEKLRPSNLNSQGGQPA